MASAHPSLAYEWLALWDCALDYGTLGTKVSQTVFKIMCKPVFGDNICCYCLNTIDEPSFLNHLTVAHALDQHTLFSSLSTNKTALFLPPLSIDFYLSLWFLLLPKVKYIFLLLLLLMVYMYVRTWVREYCRAPQFVSFRTFSSKLQSHNPSLNCTAFM